MMKRLITLLSVVFLAGCGPQFLRNAHNYEPEPKPRIVSYWACESAEEYFWGDCNWSFGYYLPIDGEQRLVGVSWCMGSELDAGFALNAVYEDRDKFGPLETSQLGSQPHMHCKMLTSFMATSTQEPLGRHEAEGRVKGVTYVSEGETSLSLVHPDDNTIETRGHEMMHQYWKGEWEQKSWAFEYPINSVGLQPSLPVPPTIVHRRIPADPPPIRDYNDDWHINRGQPKGVPYDVLVNQ
jgi:hypothetical protein